MSLTLFNTFDLIFDDFFPKFRAIERAEPDFLPRMDIKEKDSNYIIHAELPGVPKDAINIELKDGVLSISGEKSFQKKEENEKYYRVERSYGKFSRSLYVPNGITEDQIKATYNDGVLEIAFPKEAKQDVKKIAVA
jgi:HSP20 family protein